MVTSEVLTKLKSAYTEWNASRGTSVATWMNLMADDVQMRSLAAGKPGMEFSAPRDGKHTLHDYFSALSTEWEMLDYTAEEYVVDGDRVVMFGKCEFRNRKTGKAAKSPVVCRWRFANGLAVEYFEMYDTASAFAAATPDAS